MRDEARARVPLAYHRRRKAAYAATATFGTATPARPFAADARASRVSFYPAGAHDEARPDRPWNRLVSLVVGCLAGARPGGGVRGAPRREGRRIERSATRGRRRGAREPARHPP